MDTATNALLSLVIGTLYADSRSVAPSPTAGSAWERADPGEYQLRQRAWPGRDGHSGRDPAADAGPTAAAANAATTAARGGMVGMRRGFSNEVSTARTRGSGFR